MASKKQEIIEELRNLLETEDVAAIKEQVDRLKTRFYAGGGDSLAEVAQAADAEEAAAVAEEVPAETAEEVPAEATEEIPAEDPAEVEDMAKEDEEFKALLAEYKARRAALAAVQAKEQAENLSKKQAILDEMQQLVESATADGVMPNIQRMKELQTEWKDAGAVPIEKLHDLRKRYQQLQEQFYDLVKINIELRDLDFKKNLELKTLLCEAAEKLQETPSVVEASRMLQQLHDEWAEIGPVAREIREQLWERFKAASTVINKKHQAYFDELHRKEQENYEKKQALVEQMRTINEPIVNGVPMSVKEWDEATAKVQALQAEWRTIGFAPKKFNQSIYDAFRAECDRFYQTKKEFFRELREQRKLREQRHKEYLERQAAREQAREERRKQRMERITSGGGNLRKMRDKLVQEIKTAENNILFFTAKSKGANKIVSDMQKKIDELKSRLAEIEQQLAAEENE